MSAGFTPGPWAAEYCSVDQVYHIEAGAWPLGSNVCEIGKEPREGEPQANANLIAAAPTMAAYIQRKADEGDTEAAAIMEVVHGRG